MRSIAKNSPRAAWLAAPALAMLVGGLLWLEAAAGDPGSPEPSAPARAANPVTRMPRFLDRLNQSNDADDPPMWYALWHNGDFDQRDWLPNGYNTSIQDARVYDDFIVTIPPRRLCLCQLFSNNFMDFPTDRANWEIRYGVGENNPGVLVAQGRNSPALQTPTGRFFRGLPEFTIAVDFAEPVYICVSARSMGHFWLNVSPVGDGTGQSFIGTTSGANAIGNPPGNNGMSFIDSPTLGYNFEATENVLGAGTWDFSEGVDIMPMP